MHRTFRRLAVREKEEKVMVRMFKALAVAMMVVAAGFARAAGGGLFVTDDNWGYSLSNGCAIVQCGPNAIEGTLGIPASLDGHPVIGISDYAFAYRDDIVRLSIPSPVETIGSQAFSNCSELEIVDLPDTMKYIESAAFAYCTSLANISIPDSVTRMSNAFYGCGDQLFDIDFIPDVRCVDGWVHDAYAPWGTMKEVLDLTDARGICGNAFGGQLLPRKVIVPPTFTHIPAFAFELHVGLEAIVIPETVVRIDEAAFRNCSSLTKIVLPGGLREIAEFAFTGCAVTNLIIPASVTNIDDNAFYWSEVSFEVSKDNANYKSANGCLLTKDGATLIAAPGFSQIEVPDSVVNIKDKAFAGRECTRRITFPAAVANIPPFEACYNLDDIVFKGNAPVLDDCNRAPSECDCLYGYTVYVRHGSTGWNVEIPGTWHGACIEYLDEATVLPELPDNATEADVAAGLGGATDAKVAECVRTKAEYDSFREWAFTVKGTSGDGAAGAEAVMASPHAAAAYLLGAERLLENEPEVKFGEVKVGGDNDRSGAGGALGTIPAVIVEVKVKDGDRDVKVDAAKVAAMFEATSDLGDWDNGQLPVSTEVVDAAAMRFCVSVAGGSGRAFLRIRR